MCVTGKQHVQAKDAYNLKRHLEICHPAAHAKMEAAEEKDHNLQVQYELSEKIETMLALMMACAVALQ